MIAVTSARRGRPGHDAMLAHRGPDVALDCARSDVRAIRSLRPTSIGRMRLIDSHGHLQATAFADDAAEVLADARDAGPGAPAGARLGRGHLARGHRPRTGPRHPHRRSACIPHLAHGRDDCGSGPRSRRSRPAAGACHRRDRPRLRPGLLAAGRPARQPALAHRAGIRAPASRSSSIAARSPAIATPRTTCCASCAEAGVGSAPTGSGSVGARPRCSTRSRDRWTTRGGPRAWAVR